MSKIIIYFDESEKTEEGYRFSGDPILAGRSLDLQGKKINRIKELLEIIFETLGPDGVIEMRGRL
jgi:hypothetical protein